MTLLEDVGRVLKELRYDEPYYTFFMSGLHKQASTDIPTMAVGFVNDINVKLFVNPDFWFSLTENQKKGLCKHEMLHIVFFHLLTKKPDHIKDNIACDLEINQYISREYLPKDGIFLEEINQKFNLKLEPKKGREYYYNNLPDDVCKQIQLGDAKHNWEDTDLNEAVKQNIESSIRAAMDAAVKAMAPGKVPGEISERMVIEKAPSRVYWGAHLRRFVDNVAMGDKKNTRLKPNPYFIDNPSSKIKFKNRILCIFDTSGSVSQSELQEFGREIDFLYRKDNAIDILCIDTQMYPIKQYNGKLEVEIKGRGGTVFDTGIEFFNTSSYQSMIYFTDGEAPVTINAKKPMLWVITRNGCTSYIENHNSNYLKIN